MKLVYTGKFKKDFKKVKSRRKDQRKLFSVVEQLLDETTLHEKYKDHCLGGNWSRRRECHIEPDWLLIYYLHEDTLILERTGSHSDLFG